MIHALILFKTSFGSFFEDKFGKPFSFDRRPSTSGLAIPSGSTEQALLVAHGQRLPGVKDDWFQQDLAAPIAYVGVHTISIALKSAGTRNFRWMQESFSS